MKNKITILLVCLTIISCSKTYDELGKTDDPQTGARLVQEVHTSYPTYKSKFAEQAELELKEKGDDSKLSEMHEVVNPRVIDSLYALHFREFVMQNGFRRPLTERYHAVIKSYSSNDYKQTFVRSGLSKKLLLNAGLLESDDTESLSFYTTELIDSQMGEYSLIIRCLEKMRGKILDQELRKMTNRLAVQIEKSKFSEVDFEKKFKIMIAEREAFFEKNKDVKKGRMILRLWKEMDFGKRRADLDHFSESLASL